MHNYSVAVALFDYLPVLLSGLGLFWLARGVAARHRRLASVAFGAALLVPFGGLCKATWKLLVALGQPPLNWLENLLFIAMAPGFAAISFSLFHAVRAWQRNTAPQQADYPAGRLLLWLALPLLGGLIIALLAPLPRAWFFWLLGATTVANAALIVHAVGASYWSGLRWPAALFIYNFVATLMLSGLSRLPPGEATAWIQEGVNFSAQGALALAAWQLGRRMREVR